MKQSLFITALICLFQPADAQKISFTDTGNHWVARSECSCDPYGYDIPFSWGRDTVINGRAYRYLGTPGWPGHMRISSAWLREDHAAGKVYMRRSGLAPSTAEDTTERILYDYTLAIGDTVKVDVGSLHSRHFVAGIDSTELNGVIHKVWLFSGAPSTGGTPNYPYAVIEGIGSIRHPLFPAFPLMFENRERLSCFRQSGTSTPKPGRPIVWGPTTFDNSCALTVPATGFPAPLTAAVIPNPVSGNAHVALSRIVENGELQLFDTRGHLWHIQRIRSRQGVSISVEKLPPGAYYLIITDSRGSEKAMAKLMVVR